MSTCEIAPKQKTWSYEQYYIGPKDVKNRRNGSGENHWTGAKSLEKYVGNFVQNAMNGQGDYYWRYEGPEGTHMTYEGRFFANQMHGYGNMSYPDGRTFTGLFYNNIRFGPGIQRHINLQADVGFWCDQHLVRLAWRPKGINIVPNFYGPKGKPFVNEHRTLLAKKCTIIGATNSALELLKHYGADPVWASKNWQKLYSPYCTDLQSLACQVSLFERSYYRGRYLSLEEVTSMEPEKESSFSGDELLGSERQDPDFDTEYFYAWNNNKMIVDMMKHCYQHDKFRDSHLKLPFSKILNGPRRHLRVAGNHERYCRNLIMASYLGYIVNVVQLVNELNVNPDVADVQGNTPLIYATCGDHIPVIEFLVEAGADVNGFNDSCLTALGIAIIRLLCFVKKVGIKQTASSLLPDKPPQQPDIVGNEWIIDRDIPLQIQIEIHKASRMNLAKKSLLNSKSSSRIISKRALTQPSTWGHDFDSDDSFSDEKRMYTNLRHEYDIKLKETLNASPDSLVPYVFIVEDMNKNIEAAVQALMQKEIESKGVFNPKKSPVKETKPSKPDPKVRVSLVEITEVSENTTILETISQLLACGADPRLVVFPLPALFMATVACSPALVKLLLEHGVDVNEKFTTAMDYTALDIAVSKKLTPSIVKIVQTLLNNGANADHRLPYPDEPGPNLLHAVMVIPVSTPGEEEMCEELFKLLLNHCDPFVQFKGFSAVDLIISNRIDYLYCLCKLPKIDLNTTINSLNQTILLQLFTFSVFKNNVSSEVDIKSLVKELVVNGANPLLPCLDHDEKYLSLFEYVQTILSIIDPNLTEEITIKSPSTSEPDVIETQKPNLRPVSPLKKAELPPPALVAAYKEAIDVMIEHTRTIHARYVQANMVKSLVEVIYKFKHRHWHMIFKEFHELNLVAFGIWLTPQRCFDIWHIYSKTPNKIYKDERTLKHLIAIILFHCYENDKNKPDPPKDDIIKSLNGRKRRKIDADTKSLVKDYMENYETPPEIKYFRNAYIKPELATKADETFFNVCYNCCMPLVLYRYQTKCMLCKAVTFCSPACMMHSIDETTSHPCTRFLKEQASSVSTLGGVE